MGQHVSRLLATLAPLLVLCVANVAAQPRPVVMGGDSGYRPFHYLDERGRARGFDVEMLREIMRTEGIPVRFEFGDWGDALARLERGEVAVVPMFISRDRQERYLFSKPFILRYHVVYGRAGTPPVRSLDGLAGRTVAVQSASLASDVLHAMPGVAPGLLGVRFEPDALEAVAQGRAQYALVPTGIGHAAMKHQEISGLVALSPPLLEREYAFAVSRSRPELVPLIDAGLDRMRTSGRQDQLFRDSLEGAGGTTDWLRWTVLAVLLAATAITVSVILAAGLRARARDTRVDGMSGPDAARLASELRAAMAGGELGYALQPKLDLRTRRWAGAEVLVRWQHPQHGKLMPGAFLPIAERAGLGGAMTLYLTRRAAADFREWGARGSALTLSVNISAADLADHALLAALADAAGPACPSLVLEVTETDIMGDPGRIASAVAQLRRRGIRLSIDDFGTGHSSLTKLRLLEADEIKIDRSFVRDVLQSRSDQAIVRSTIQLAHAVGAKVTAEGIEDGATLEWLTAAGCDYGQGFALARPMRPAGFGLMLAGMPVFKGAALS